MKRNRIERADCKQIASQFGLDEREVMRAVDSFFGCIIRDVKKLPFNNPKKIYKKEKFDEYTLCWNIPYIGRIGTVYSRYLSWRRNESKMIEQVNRNRYRNRIPQDEIENIAGDILSGTVPPPVQKKKPTELYNRVWLVGKNGKWLANQVIPKKANV